MVLMYSGPGPAECLLGVVGMFVKGELVVVMVKKYTSQLLVTFDSYKVTFLYCQWGKVGPIL